MTNLNENAYTMSEIHDEIDSLFPQIMKNLKSDPIFLKSLETKILNVDISNLISKAIDDVFEKNYQLKCYFLESGPI